MTKDELREKANDLPLAPGVYLMMDKAGQVIYVGKAKKLKNRVSQYFQDTASHNSKTKMMVSQVDRFDTILVRTEFEALVLENSLIKRHMPRYNILLKDDKGYPFVRLERGAAYPRFTLVSRAGEDDARYFGPFGGRRETRLAIEAVCGALRLPTCARKFPRDIGKERPCLNKHIGKCDGFCQTDGPGQEEYARRIEQAVGIFTGHYKKLTGELQREMEQAAEALDFERAAALRDRIRSVSVLGKTQQVIAGVCADTDVWGLYRGQVRWGFGVLHLEDGNLLGREVKVLAAGAEEDEGEILSAVLRQYYEGRGAVPREICVAALPEDREALEEVLAQGCGHKVSLRVPRRGQRAELLRMAQNNAREETERVTSETERTNKTLEQLGDLAGLSHAPRRIEAYDISNTGSADMVASMVVFCDGRPLKKEYRKFQIKTLEHPDDYAAMREVLGRRLQRYLDGDEKFSPLPDLILMDGGQQHAAVAEEVLAQKGLSVAVLGMVKDDRHRTRALMTAQGQELGIRCSPPLFTLVGQVQEEVHRFAITYHRKKHSRSAVRSRLDGINGLGEARRKALLKQFGSVRAVMQAELAELEAVLPKAVAGAVYDRFHEEKTKEK